MGRSEIRGFDASVRGDGRGTPLELIDRLSTSPGFVEWKKYGSRGGRCYIPAAYPATGLTVYNFLLFHSGWDCCPLVNDAVSLVFPFSFLLRFLNTCLFLIRDQRGGSWG